MITKKTTSSVSLTDPAPVGGALRPHIVVTPPRIDRDYGPLLRTPSRIVGTRSGWLSNVAIFAADLLVLTMIGGVSVSMLSLSGVSVTWGLGVYTFWSLVVLAFFHFAGLNRVASNPPASELRWLVLIVGGTALTISAGICATGVGTAAEICFLPLVASGLMFVWPVVRHAARMRLSRKDWWGIRVILVGGHAQGATIYHRLARHPEWGFRPVAVLEELDDLDLSVAPEHYYGPSDKLAETAERLHVSTVVVIPREATPPSIEHLVQAARKSIHSWLVVPSLQNVPAMWNDAFDFKGHAAIGWRNRLASPVQRIVKRVFDLILVAGTCLFWLPIISAIALAIRLTTRGPAFFVQERMGFRRSRFPVYKFRTMRVNGDAILQNHLEKHPELRAEWSRNFKLRNDPRVTPIGRLLRKTSLDELPQLFNVALGQMSLVGPRPLLESELERYGDAYESYIQTIPGITGMWQISGRSDTTFADRAWLDEYYVRNWSPWLDLYILGHTVNVVVRCNGAY